MPEEVEEFGSKSMTGSMEELELAEAQPEKKPLPGVDLHHDARPKKLSGKEQIKEQVKEIHEVIAYMDYSFERAFTIQEKQYMLAYQVGSTSANHTDLTFMCSNTQPRFKATSTV